MRLPLKPGNVLPAPPGSICDFLLTQPRTGPGNAKLDAGGSNSHRVTLRGMTGALLLTPAKWTLFECLALHVDLTSAFHFTQGKDQFDYSAENTVKGQGLIVIQRSH
jgi:hypothetical protein